jgi:hypothetical protein
VLRSFFQGSILFSPSIALASGDVGPFLLAGQQGFFNQPLAVHELPLSDNPPTPAFGNFRHQPAQREGRRPDALNQPIKKRSSDLQRHVTADPSWCAEHQPAARRAT